MLSLARGAEKEYKYRAKIAAVMKHAPFSTYKHDPKSKSGSLPDEKLGNKKFGI